MSRSAWRRTGCGRASRSSSPTTCIRPTTRSCPRRRGCATARPATSPRRSRSACRPAAASSAARPTRQSPEALFTHVAGLKTVVAVEPVRREGPAHRGDRGRRPGDLPRAEAPLQRAVRRPPRPADRAVVASIRSARCPRATTRSPLGTATRAPRRAASSRCWRTARWCTSRSRRGGAGIDAEIIDLRTLCPSISTRSSRRSEDRALCHRPRGDAHVGLWRRTRALVQETASTPSKPRSNVSPVTTRRTRMRTSGTTSRAAWCRRGTSPCHRGERRLRSASPYLTSMRGVNSRCRASTPRRMNDGVGS